MIGRVERASRPSAPPSHAAVSRPVRRAEQPARGGVRDHLVRALGGEHEAVGEALDEPLQAAALREGGLLEAPERLRELVHEHVEEARVALAERVGPRGLEHDDPHGLPFELDRRA